MLRDGIKMPTPQSLKDDKYVEVMKEGAIDKKKNDKEKKEEEKVTEPTTNNVDVDAHADADHCGLYRHIQYCIFVYQRRRLSWY
jgi:hypothetical protein